MEDNKKTTQDQKIENLLDEFLESIKNLSDDQIDKIHNNLKNLEQNNSK